MPDPRVSACIAELQEIVRRYDLAATLLVVSETHQEWCYELSPSWSALRLVDDNGRPAIRLKLKSSDFPTPELAHAALTRTVQVAAAMEAATRAAHADMEHLARMVGQHVPYSHWQRRDG